MPEDNIYIYGRKPVEEALLSRPEKIEKIFVKDSLYSSFHKVKELASFNRVPVVKVPSQKLFDLVGKVNDQGIVALLSRIEYLEFFDWLLDVDLEDNPCLFLLDGIEDPHNFGAILRSAAAANVYGIIVPKHGQAPVNATVHKTSAGTAGKIPIIRVNNTTQALVDLKNAGFWVTALDASGDKTIWDMDYNRPLIFVLGNEGKGISPAILKKCDIKMAIPMENEVESLNVSVSASLVAYEIKRKKTL